jgi:hypothetical protein
MISLGVCTGTFRFRLELGRLHGVLKRFKKPIAFVDNYRYFSKLETNLGQKTLIDLSFLRTYGYRIHGT